MPTPAVSVEALRVEWELEGLLMHSQDLDTNILVEPADPQAVPARGASSAPFDSTTDEPDLEELLDYKSVPPRRIGSISIQYHHLGRGRPLPYPLKDDEE
jgi:hypothetical protein